MITPRLSRRRALTILAASGGFACLGGQVPGELVSQWRGTALGAEGRLLLAGMARRRAREVIAMALAEVERLEAVFSLYRPDSELSRLNASGRIEGASHDLRVLTRQSLDYWRRSGGTFNPAIQPVWAFLARHFATRPDVEPDGGRLAEALAFSDVRRIEMSGSCIALAPGMALSFNGIAQGYITDRVAELLRRAGFADVLVDLGELRALPGRSWAIGLGDGGVTVDLAGRALATSAPAGTRFTVDGRWHHLIDPASGRSAAGFRSLSVIAASATEADALATARTGAGPVRATEVAAGFAGLTVRAVLADGRPVTIAAG